MSDGIPVVPLADMARETARIEAASRKGIECPRCACRHWLTIKTKPHDGEIGRRKECRHCGYRITTSEMAVSGD